MATKRNLGIIYEYNENWIGGSYYIQNLISALCIVDEIRKPHIIIFCSNPEHFQKLKDVTQYPYLEHREILTTPGLCSRIVNKIYRTLFGKNLLNPYCQHTDIDLVFPGGYEFIFPQIQKFLYWIPDFQEAYYPSFFTQEEIRHRSESQQNIIKRGMYIVFSSQAAMNDFNRIYPGNTLTQFLMPFAVTHPSSVGNIGREVISKYHLPDSYYICSNQFWKHKNQGIILKAVGALKRSGKNITVAFTGKEQDRRNPDYFEQLKKIVEQEGISDNIRFLGFISREDQLALVKQAQAVLQPSLFEGWSTVVEDAKSMGARLIVSDLPVHREQLVHYPSRYFFEPENVASLLAAFEASESSVAVTDGGAYYAQNILNYADTFLKMFDQIMADENMDG